MEVKLQFRGSPWLVLLVFLTLRLVHTEPLGNCQLWLTICCDPLNLPVYLLKLGSGNLPCNLTSLMDIKRMVDFSFCSIFCLLLEYSNDFQGPYTLKQKPELQTHSCLPPPPLPYPKHQWVLWVLPPTHSWIYLLLSHFDYYQIQLYLLPEQLQ